MQYSLEAYDKHGFLKPPIWLWLGWFFLARAWVVFVMAGASRNQGSDLLTMFYPDHDRFYLGLLLGLPIILLMWLFGIRKKNNQIAEHVWRYGRLFTILVVLIDLVMVVEQIIVSRGQFHWVNAIVLLLLSWLLLFLYKSRRVKDCFITESVGES